MGFWRDIKDSFRGLGAPKPSDGYTSIGQEKGRQLGSKDPEKGFRGMGQRLEKKENPFKRDLGESRKDFEERKKEAADRQRQEVELAKAKALLAAEAKRTESLAKAKMLVEGTRFTHIDMQATFGGRAFTNGTGSAPVQPVVKKTVIEVGKASGGSVGRRFVLSGVGTATLSIGAGTRHVIHYSREFVDAETMPASAGLLYQSYTYESDQWSGWLITSGDVPAESEQVGEDWVALRRVWVWAEITMEDGVIKTITPLHAYTDLETYRFQGDCEVQ